MSNMSDDAFEIPNSHIPERDDASACQTVVQAASSHAPNDEERDLIVVDTGTASADEEEASDAEAVVVDLNEPKARGEPQPVACTGRDGLSREDLRALCRSSELRVRGTKRELVERLSGVEEARA